MVNQLDYTQAWLCSVNTVNSLQKEAQQLKQGTTLKQITDAMHRLTFRTSQERQQQGSYSIILSFDLAYQTEILNNQGGKLENHLFKELQQYLGVNPWVCLIILWDWLLQVLKTARLTLPSYVYWHGWKNEFKTSIDAQNFGRD